MSEPKGNGKSGLVAGICLAGLLGPLAEERGAVYAASIDRGKAGILYEEVKAIILRVPEFAARVNIVDFHKRIQVLKGDGFDSVFEALSADARRAQGLSPTLWAYDELGEAPDGQLLSVLLESEGKRDHTLGIVLSTQAADDDHPLSRLIDDALTRADQSVYLQLHAAPPDADPWADETIKAANPAWGKFLDLDAVLKSRDRARRIPAYDAAYRRLRLNQRIDARSDERLVTASVWKQNAGAVDRAALGSKSAFGGLDLAGKHDLCAFTLVFPDQIKPAGFIKLVPGDVITTSVVARDLAEIRREFDIKAIYYDRWRVDYLKSDLAEIGVELPMEPFGQGHSKAMAPAIEFLAECALSSRLRHGANPVLTASVSGAILTLDSSGNPKIDKPKSNRRGPVRIDGAVALTMALGAAKEYEPPPPKPSLEGMLRDPIMVI